MGREEGIRDTEEGIRKKGERIWDCSLGFFDGR
jgi:hypothetical protein